MCFAVAKLLQFVFTENKTKVSSTVYYTIFFGFYMHLKGKKY